MYDLNIIHIIFWYSQRPKSSSDYLCNVRLRVPAGHDKMRPCKMVNYQLCLVFSWFCMTYDSLYQTEMIALYFKLLGWLYSSIHQYEDWPRVHVFLQQKAMSLYCLTLWWCWKQEKSSWDRIQKYWKLHCVPIKLQVPLVQLHQVIFAAWLLSHSLAVSSLFPVQ